MDLIHSLIPYSTIMRRNVVFINKLSLTGVPLGCMTYFSSQAKQAGSSAALTLHVNEICTTTAIVCYIHKECTVSCKGLRL